MSKSKSNHTKVVEHLHKRKQAAYDTLANRFPHVQRKLQDLNFALGDIRRHSAKALSSAAIAGGLLVGSPAIDSTVYPTLTKQELPLQKDQLIHAFQKELAKILPKQVGPLTPDAEAEVSKVIKENLGIDAFAELDGNHLNTAYGFMGAEQHLPRFQGDTIDQHDELQEKGITASRGAFGYFARNRQSMTQEEIMREKYYVAVQTLYLPNWNKDHRHLKTWYAFREVLVVNPANGRSVVAVVGDAGPAAWTGKHFGGSPEVMAHLGLTRGKQKGAVILFFLDEKNQPVALGPVEHKQGMFIAENK